MTPPRVIALFVAIAGFVLTMVGRMDSAHGAMFIALALAIVWR